MEICRENLNLIEIGQKYRVFRMPKYALPLPATEIATKALQSYGTV
jgi:hypothetical protein